MIRKCVMSTFLGLNRKWCHASAPEACSESTSNQSYAFHFDIAYKLGAMGKLCLPVKLTTEYGKWFTRMLNTLTDKFCHSQSQSVIGITLAEGDKFWSLASGYWHLVTGHW